MPVSPRNAIERLDLAIRQDDFERAIHELNLLQPVGKMSLDLAARRRSRADITWHHMRHVRMYVHRHVDRHVASRGIMSGMEEKSERLEAGLPRSLTSDFWLLASGF